MQSKNVSFPNAEGEKLSGILDMPERAPRAFALFAHCFTCSKNLKAATNIARAMNDAGIAVLRLSLIHISEPTRLQ